MLGWCLSISLSLPFYLSFVWWMLLLFTFCFFQVKSEKMNWKHRRNNKKQRAKTPTKQSLALSRRLCSKEFLSRVVGFLFLWVDPLALEWHNGRQPSPIPYKFHPIHLNTWTWHFQDEIYKFQLQESLLGDFWGCSWFNL